jgi:cell division protein FtsQ
MPRLTLPRLKPRAPRRAQRRRFGWRPSRRLIGGVLIGSGVALFAGAGLYVWRAGMPDNAATMQDRAIASAIAASADVGLSVQEIFVEGRSETAAALVLDAVGARRGDPIFAFSPTAAKARLEALGWVRQASVERLLPGTIMVRINERQPLALWQRHKQLSLIDRDGVEIPGVDLGRFTHLPVVVGDDAPAHAANLLALLATEPTLERRVSAAVRVGGRRWNLKFDNGIDVQLPEINAGAAWMRLAEVERDGKLLSRDISAVDLRLPDRLVVRVVKDNTPAPTPGAKPARGGQT